MAEEEKNSKADEKPQEQENLGSKEAGAGEEKAETQEPGQGAEQEISKDARTWAMFCHLAGLAGCVLPLAGNIVGPLVLWQLKKEQFPYVDEQGKEAVNFQISITIYAIVSIMLSFLCIGFFLLAGVIIFNFIFLLIAAVKANDGQYYRYPLAIRFIR